MGQYFQVNGDYNIKVKSGGTITLDTGINTGTTYITGDLVVQGNSTTVNTANLEIEDNIITVNKNEAGPGVTLRYSGLEVFRGTGTSRIAFLFDETTPTGISGSQGTWILATNPGSAPGTSTTAFTFADSNLKLRRILTDAAYPDLVLIGTGNGVVTVTGTQDYELQITDDDDIPNKKYVDDAIQNNPTIQIARGDTRFIVGDKDVAGSLLQYSTITGYGTGGESAAGIFVDGLLNSTFYVNRAQIQGIEFIGHELTNNDTNSNVYIRTNGTGKLQTNYALQLDHPGVDPASVNGSHVVYAGTESIGASGVYFASINTRGELISKNKALVFSMLF